MSTATPSPVTLKLFSNNRLAAFKPYVRENEVVPHFYSRGSYYLTRNIMDEVVAPVNSCLHRGYKLVTERAFKPKRAVTCPMHGRCYSVEGGLMTHEGQKQNVSLPAMPLADINGFYFELGSIRSIPKLREGLFWTEGMSEIDFKDFIFEAENVSFYQVGWDVIIELMLDETCQELRHPGFAAYLDTPKSTPMLGDMWSLSRYEISDADRGNVASPAWQRFRQEIKRVGWNKKWGYQILAIYPGTTVELFPHVMVVSTVLPLHDGLTTQYTQVYFDKTVKDDWEFCDSFGDAYNERANQRGIMQDFLEDGRRVDWHGDLKVDQETQPALNNFTNWASRYGDA